MEFAFGSTEPRLPSREYNQHGVQQPEMWPHQKSQETSNEVHDNSTSQQMRRSSKFSSGHFRGGSDRWRQTPAPAAATATAAAATNRQPRRHHHHHQQPTVPSQRKRRVVQQQQQPSWRQQRSDDGLGMNADFGDNNSEGFDGLGGGMGGLEIHVVDPTEGMTMGGNDGDPFQYCPSPTIAAAGGSPRLNGQISRKGIDVLGPAPAALPHTKTGRAGRLSQQQIKRNERNRQNIHLVSALPDAQQNLHPPLACRADLELHQNSTLGSGGRGKGSGKGKGKGPRIRRKNAGKAKELPSYMRPTAATKLWQDQTKSVKKMDKATRAKQIY